jgi:hypothetical protein
MWQLDIVGVAHFVMDCFDYLDAASPSNQPQAAGVMCNFPSFLPSFLPSFMLQSTGFGVKVLQYWWFASAPLLANMGSLAEAILENEGAKLAPLASNARAK